MKEWIDIIREIEFRLDSNLEFVLATVVKVEGSAYRSAGARMLVMDDGNWIGGISGGCLEGDLLKKAQQAIIRQKTSLITYDTREDDPFQLGVGLGCNGKIDIILDPIRENILAFIISLKEVLNSSFGGRIFQEWNLENQTFEIEKSSYSSVHKLEKSQSIIKDNRIQLKEEIPPIYQIWLFGVSFDAAPVVEMALSLGWRVNWVGNPLKMSENLKSRCFGIFHWNDNYVIDKSHFVILMTHDIERDIEILNRLATNLPIRYFGALGPLKRWEKLMGLVEGSTKLSFEHQEVHTPIGLKIGAEGPQQIAIAIFAELIELVSVKGKF